MGRILILLVALISMGTAANATTLAAGGLYGGSTQNSVLCILYNFGVSAVSVSGGQISSEFALVPTTFNSCAGTLAAGGFCSIQANIRNDIAHACKVDILPNATTVRGEFVIRNASTGTSQIGATVGSITVNTVLQIEQLR